MKGDVVETPDAAHETVIVGAGPAGLAAAVCLARRGLPYLLLEQGERPGAALAQIDPDITLVSPTPFSRLPGMESLKGQSSYLDFGTYFELLERYRDQHGIAVTTAARVEQVERTPDGFRVSYRTPEGTRHVSARFVINATGVLSAPHLPADFEPQNCSITWCHSRELRREALTACRRLLLVGGGISAADTVHDWLGVRGADDRAWLSLKSRLWTAPKRILGVDVHYWVWLVEQLPPLPLVWRKFQRNPILGGELKAAIRRGEVLPVSAVARYHRDRVELTSGDALEPDLIVFATGYTYATPHLGDLFSWPKDKRPRVRRCESLDAPGLFLLGLHFGRNFASPFLRGIARDAEYTARQIAERRRGSE